jgi:hypothetical protein
LYISKRKDCITFLVAKVNITNNQGVMGTCCFLGGGVIMGYIPIEEELKWK